MINGNVDFPMGAEYGGADATANVEDSKDSLFREIGTTLRDVAKTGLSTIGETVKTSLANKIINSPEGQAQVSAYKMQYVFKYLPWMALAAVVLMVGGRYLFPRA